VSDGFVLNSWGPPKADSQPPAPLPAMTGGPVASPTAIPPAPAGVNVPEYRKEAGKKAADDDQLLRTKAQGAIEFLDLSPSVKKTYQSNPNVFGPWSGTDTAQSWVRAPLRAVLPAGVGGDAINKDMEGFNQIKSATKQLSTLGLKAAFGGRITNAEMEQHNQMFGGLTSASAESAIESLTRMEQQHMNTLQHAVDRGLIDPSKVPRETVERGVASGALDARRFLPTIANPADASRLPKGSLFVNPDGKVLKVP
jgi:hypothetical protein